jgi:hypothetical protein
MIPTYGRPESAKDYPPDLKMELLQREIVVLTERAKEIYQSCEHHYVPDEKVTEKWEATKISDVFNAGEIGEVNRSAGISFLLVCTKCGLRGERKRVDEICPLCVSPTIGKWGPPDERKKYFSSNDFLYYGLWLIACTNPECTFRAAGLRWDQ